MGGLRACIRCKTAKFGNRGKHLCKTFRTSGKGPSRNKIRVLDRSCKYPQSATATANTISFTKWVHSHEAGDAMMDAHLY